MDPKRNESSIRERSASAVALACVLSLLSSSKLVAQQVTAKRFDDNPLITPELDPRIGTNVNGPSVIRVPEWVEGALGTYYMYFAAHRGRYIRLAYADSVEGPWRVYAPGALRIEDSLFPVSLEQIDPQIRSPAFRGKRKQPHIASPDVLVRPDLGKIVMYFHGSGVERQFTRAALSSDGIHFEVLEPRLSPPYLRVFEYQGEWFGMLRNSLYHSPDGLAPFRMLRGHLYHQNEPGRPRHIAVLPVEDRLFLFYTVTGAAPESILVRTIELVEDWRDWKAGPPAELLRPTLEWEGAGLPVSRSQGGAVGVPVNQLRDPAVIRDGADAYLFYAVQGESGIAGARLFFEGAGQ